MFSSPWAFWLSGLESVIGGKPWERNASAVPSRGITELGSAITHSRA